MLRNIVYSIISIFVFFAGVILYGFIIRSEEEPLREILGANGIVVINSPKIIIDKQHYKLELYSDGKLLKVYKAVFGKSNIHAKKNIYDNITPAGDYKICSIDTTSKYHMFLKLNYPNRIDAANALMDGAITKKEYQEIILTHEENNCMFPKSKLSVEIGIEGIGKFDIIFKNLPFIFNWTNGSIAVSNEDIEELASVVKIGTPVIIKK